MEKKEGGRKVTIKGTPDKSKQDILAQTKQRRNKPREIHIYKYSLGKNIPPPRRHDRQ